MKIGTLMFGSFRKIGGFQIFTYNLLSRLSQRGHQVDLYIPQEVYLKDKRLYDSLPFTVKPLFLRTYNFKKRAPIILKFYLYCQQLVNRYQLWQIVGAYPAAYLASWLSGRVPLVLRTHGEDIQKDAELNYGLRLDPHLEETIKYTLHKMDVVIALTQSVVSAYEELEVPEQKIIEIPNGFDSLRYQKPSDKIKTRQKWGLPLDKPVLLTVGRYHAKKGYRIIPKTARILKARGLSFSWLVVGKGTEQLKALIEQEGVSDVVRTEKEIGLPDSVEANVTLQIPHDELIRLYQCADLFVFPSKLETFGRVLVEAMAAGVPVVTTDAPGCRDVVQHGHTGLLSKPDEMEKMATHIERLIKEKALRERLIENGLRHAKQYDWEVVVSRYEELYHSLIS